DPGFRPRNLITARATVPSQNLRPMLDQLRTLPGVESVALAEAVPGSGDIGGVDFFIDQRPGERLHSQVFGVTPGYFQTLGIPLRKGRDLTERDTPVSERVIVVSESFAQRFFPGENPLGRRIQSAFTRFCKGECPWLEIVGVVGDVRD